MEIGIRQPQRAPGNADVYIRPEDSSNIATWCRKWNVTPYQIQQAILHTGSVHAPTIKDYLMRDRWLYHPIDGTAKLIRSTINYIF